VVTQATAKPSLTLKRRLKASSAKVFAASTGPEKVKVRMKLGETEPNRVQTMKTKDYTTSFTVDQSPEEVFDAINNVRGWWSGEIDGSTDKPGAEFTYRYKDVHRSTQKVIEWVPGKKVVWHVADAQLNFVKDKTEWNGTDVVFEITRKNDKTELRFTHVGLVPAFECYGGCSGAWGFYVNDSLRSLITTGKGQPNTEES
jgi:uncharacterized protein YndB with AHSA1/START domain